MKRRERGSRKARDGTYEKHYTGQKEKEEKVRHDSTTRNKEAPNRKEKVRE